VKPGPSFLTDAASWHVSPAASCAEGHPPAGRDRAEGKEVNWRPWIALVIIAGALFAVLALLTIETSLIDWGDW